VNHARALKGHNRTFVRQKLRQEKKKQELIGGTEGNAE